MKLLQLFPDCETAIFAFPTLIWNRFPTRKTWKIDVKISSCGKLSSAVEVSRGKEGQRTCRGFLCRFRNTSFIIQWAVEDSTTNGSNVCLFLVKNEIWKILSIRENCDAIRTTMTAKSD